MFRDTCERADVVVLFTLNTKLMAFLLVSCPNFGSAGTSIFRPGISLISELSLKRQEKNSVGRWPRELGVRDKGAGGKCGRRPLWVSSRRTSSSRSPTKFTFAPAYGSMFGSPDVNIVKSLQYFSTGASTARLRVQCVNGEVRGPLRFKRTVGVQIQLTGDRA